METFNSFSTSITTEIIYIITGIWYTENFKITVDAVHLDVDLAENLSILVNYEPQSLHWSHEQVTIHSGIVKLPTGHKSYHPYVSDDRKHNQHFAPSYIERMLEAPEVQAFDLSNVVIESDNCSGQYKSSPHFHGMQEIVNRYNIPVIWIYGIAEHRKGEINHVGGNAKNTICWEVAKGESFFSAEDIVHLLRTKFGDNENPSYCIKEVSCEELEIRRQAVRFVGHQAIDGPTSFQVIVFTPNSPIVRAADWLCLCDKYMTTSYGSCDLFKE